MVFLLALCDIRTTIYGLCIHDIRFLIDLRTTIYGLKLRFLSKQAVFC